MKGFVLSGGSGVKGSSVGTRPGRLLEEGEDVNEEDKNKILKKVQEENSVGKINKRKKRRNWK